jgi:hypothetical protein
VKVKIEDHVTGTIRDSHIVQIFIFKGEDYLGWDCFNKDSIAIGRSSTADLILDDHSIAAFQAIVFCNNGNISVELFETKSNRKVTVRPGQFDAIQVGPYTLKIKLKGVHSRINQKTPSAQETTALDKANQHKPDQDKTELYIQENISDSAPFNGNVYSGDMFMEVVKSKYDKVCDVSFLSSNQKYIIENDTRFCLAENKKGAGQFVYFQGHHEGTIHPDNSTRHALETLRTAEYIFHKRKRIYRYQLPKNGIAVIHDGPWKYRIKSVQPVNIPVHQAAEAGLTAPRATSAESSASSFG